MRALHRSIRPAGNLPGSAQARARAQDRPGSPEPKPALYIAPPLMQTATRGPHRRLARQLREAALRATPTELNDLDRLDRLVRSEALGVFDAQQILTTVIRGQHERDDQERAA
jgi:hypothetical protein